MICRRGRCRAEFQPMVGIHAHDLGYCSTVCRYDLTGVVRTCKCGANFAPTCPNDRACVTCHVAHRRERANSKNRTYRAKQTQAKQARVTLDLPPSRIEAIIEASAARRRRTRSWLRITDPWAQRPGVALHERCEGYEL